MNSLLHSFLFSLARIFASGIYALLVAALIFPSPISLTRLSAAPVETEETKALMPSKISVEEMRNTFQALSDFSDALRREDFDPAALVRTLGTDPTDIASWVETNISWVPYQGHLRTPSAVIMDQTGNSLDQAILLYRLLELAGHNPSLASAEVSEAWMKEQLLNPAEKQEGLRKAIRPGKLMPDEGIEDPKALRIMNEVATLRTQQLTRIASRAARQSDLISAWLNEEQFQEAPPSLSRTHWWVHLKQGDQHFDPSGAPTVKAASFIQYAELPEEFQHRLEFEVQVERLENKALIEESAVRTTQKLSEIGNKRVLLGITPTEMTMDYAGISDGTTAGEAFTQLASAKEWTPYFQIGSNLITESSFAEDGTLNQNLNAPASAKALNTATGLLGGLGAATPQKKLSQLTQVRVRIRSISPGKEDIVTYRTLYDALSVEERQQAEQGSLTSFALSDSEKESRALSIATMLDVFVQSSLLTRNFVTGEALAHSLANRNAVLGTLHYSEKGNSEKMGQSLEKIGRTSEELYDLALTRFLLHPQQERLYLERPNLIGFHQQLAQNSDGQVLKRVGYDLLSTPLSVQPGQKDTRLIRIQQAVLDNVTESVLAEPKDAGSLSASQELEALDAKTWIAVHSLEELAPLQEKLDPIYFRNLKESLAKGSSVVLPPDYATRSSEKAVWWEIDHASGWVTGRIGPEGWGGKSSEYLINLYIAKAALTMLAVGANECLKNPTASCIGCTGVSGGLIAAGIFAGSPEMVLAVVVAGMVANVVCALLG